MSPAIVLVDNHDSFTWNLAHLVGAVTGRLPTVVRNDEVTGPELAAMRPAAVVLSPGPGHPGVPRDFGVCGYALTRMDVPVLGVCLGHQGMAQVGGGAVTHAPVPLHGRVDRVRHDGSDLFVGLPAEFDVVRYHSLAVTRVPVGLVATAWTADGVVMALRDVARPHRGVQFHPESVATEHGAPLVANFLVRVAGVDLPRSVAVPGLPRRAPPAPAQAHVRRLPEVDAADAFGRLYAASATAVWLDSSLVDPAGAGVSLMADAAGPLAYVLTYDVATGTVTEDRHGVTRTVPGRILDVLAQRLGPPVAPPAPLPVPFAGGFVGYLGYEVRADLGYPSRHRAATPDAAYLYVDRAVLVDHASGETWLVALGAAQEAQAWFDDVQARLAAPPRAAAPARPPAPGPLPLRLRRHQGDYEADVREALRAIGDGESYEVCLTNEIGTDPVADPLGLYRVLRVTSPAPYSTFLRFGDLCVLSSSPELFLRVDADGAVRTKPIKGTAARGADDASDRAAADALRSSVKDRAENLMIVDLLRNDLGRVCELGSVEVPELMAVESYATVHQLVSTVTGRLRPDAMALDALRAAFPGGSMTGAPKERTVEILDRLETGPRGVYAGTIGWLAASGAADLNIVIRTAVLTPQRTSIGVGGAVVALSDPGAEFAETLLKARGLVDALVRHRHGDAPGPPPRWEGLA